MSGDSSSNPQDSAHETSVHNGAPPGHGGVVESGSADGRRAIITNPEALSDPEYSDEDAPPVEEIAADEDLLEGYEVDVDQIDLIHCRIKSIPALNLERFTKVESLCLRQNAITSIELPNTFAATLRSLDLYDNVIGHIKGLDDFSDLTLLDLSFNKIKHIKKISHLTKLKDLYFVQNKIQTIEGLEGLSVLRQLELGGNRIRTVDGLQTLTSLEELWLGKNKITSIQGLNTLTNLKILALPSNRLTSISGVDSLVNLEELHLSDNNISKISGLDKNLKLRVLDITRNPIDHLENLACLTNLEELWASYCGFSDFSEVERELRDKENLDTVYFEGTPLQLRQPALYRNKVRLALPQIKQIDATFVKAT